jgi:hypothetical protein
MIRLDWRIRRMGISHFNDVPWNQKTTFHKEDDTIRGMFAIWANHLKHSSTVSNILHWEGHIWPRWSTSNLSLNILDTLEEPRQGGEVQRAGTVTLEEPRQGGRGEEASSTPSGVFQITLRTPRSPVMRRGTKLTRNQIDEEPNWRRTKLTMNQIDEEPNWHEIDVPILLFDQGHVTAKGVC